MDDLRVRVPPAMFGFKTEIGLAKSKRVFTELLVFGLIYGFIFSYFSPSCLLSKNIATGGDTGSHYLTAHYLVNYLLPNFKIIGWMPGHYAGFPMFQFYFPFPFLVMAGLDLFLPLQICFKMVAVLGVLLLPLCAYGSLKLMRLPFPLPVTGAVFSLPFLFMEANSMWGGNIPSTLSGEFCYGIGFSVLFLYLGSFYRGITEDRNVIQNALLLAVIGLSHGYTLLFGVLATTFFLFTTKETAQRAAYYLKVNGLAFLLLGFWIIQLLWFMPYTTPYNFVWIHDGVSSVFPPVIQPITAMAFLGILLRLLLKTYPISFFSKPVQDLLRPSAYLWFICIVASVLYFGAFKINLVDIRFIPFIQFSLMLLGAIGLYLLTNAVRAGCLLTLLVAVLTILLVDSRVNYIPEWIEWNYTGMESKPVWPQFQAVNRHLSGTCRDPRVIYEHDLRHRAAGTVRAFEMLPLFSGRSTLEGLYMQSSISSPFVFYLQSEISEKPSCPLSTYNYSRVDIPRAVEHLKIFNVGHMVAVTDELRKSLSGVEGVSRIADYPPYTIYRLTENPDRYVTVLKYEPVLLITEDWKHEAYEWFRRGGSEPLVVFKDRLDPGDAERFKTILYGSLPENPPRIPITAENRVPIKEIIRPEEVLIETSRPGLPHLIRISYHPNWHVEGAERVYLVSPGFMLIYPNRGDVRLFFGRSAPNYAGYAMSILGVLIVLFAPTPAGRRFFASRQSWKERNRPANKEKAWTDKLLYGIVSVAAVSVLAAVLPAHNHDPTVLFNKGLSHFNQGDYSKARQVFGRAMEEFPCSPIVDETAFHFAASLFKQEKWRETLNAFEWMLVKYPETRKYTEVLYHMGICRLKLAETAEAISLFNKILAECPDDRWAEYAQKRLDEKCSIDQPGMGRLSQ